jgi:haloacetate dehalogenase
MWHTVAPRLAERFSVVCADLRGYGQSGKPATDPEHAAYSKREMAREMVEVMAALGHERFMVAGHDRGARVAYRMAFDHPERVEKLAVLDIVPIYNMWARMDARAARAAYHWLLLAQDAPLPERLIGGDPIFYLHNCLQRWAAPGFQYAPEALAAYEKSFSNPETIHASCEDYRAGATIDLVIDTEDYGKRKIGCPTLVLWGGGRAGGGRPETLDTWREWAADVRGKALPCGHFLPEEAPEETAAALGEFFGG